MEQTVIGIHVYGTHFYFMCGIGLARCMHELGKKIGIINVKTLEAHFIQVFIYEYVLLIHV